MQNHRRMLVNRYKKFRLQEMDESILESLKQEMVDHETFRPVLFVSIYIVVVFVLLIAPIFDWGLYSEGRYLIKWDTLNPLNAFAREPYTNTAQVMIWPVFMVEAIPWTFL